MNNAFMRFGRTCVFTVMGGPLIAGALFAGQVNEVKVTLPHEVRVGSTILPSGRYTISSLDRSDGDEFFVVRGDHGTVAVLHSQKIDAPETSKTEVVFSTDGDAWHFDKLFVQGDPTGYELSDK